MERGIFVWNEMSVGICRSRLSTCSAIPRQASKVMPSFSAKAWMAAHTSPHMSFKAILASVRNVANLGHIEVGDCTSLHASPSKKHQLLSRDGGLWPRGHLQKLCSAE